MSLIVCISEFDRDLVYRFICQCGAVAVDGHIAAVNSPNRMVVKLIHLTI